MLTPTNQLDRVHSTSLCVSEDSVSKCENRVSEPPTDTDLQEVLEGADNILYEAKEDIPGVRFQKHGKENWVPVRAVLDCIHKDIHYLKDCKSVLDSSEVSHAEESVVFQLLTLKTRARSRPDI